MKTQLYLMLVALYGAVPSGSIDGSNEELYWENGLTKHHTESEELIFERYEKLVYKGHGSQSIVIEAYDHVEKRLVAIKCFAAPGSELSENEDDNLPSGDKSDQNPTFNENARKEWKIYQLLDGQCDSCVQAYDFKEDESGSFIIMELFDTTLDHHVKQLQKSGQLIHLKDISIITRRLAMSALRLQGLGLAHNDISPKNVFIQFADGSENFGRIAVGDFANVNRIGWHEDIVTPRYAPYERLGELMLTHANSDSWSVGMCVVFMFTNKHLFKSRYVQEVKSEQEQLFQQVKQVEPRDVIGDISEKFNQMFVSDPHDVSAQVRKLEVLIIPPFHQEEQYMGAAYLYDYLARVIVKDPEIRLSNEATLEHAFVLQ